METHTSAFLFWWLAHKWSDPLHLPCKLVWFLGNGDHTTVIKLDCRTCHGWWIPPFWCDWILLFFWWKCLHPCLAPSQLISCTLWFIKDTIKIHSFGINKCFFWLLTNKFISLFYMYEQLNLLTNYMLLARSVLFFVPVLMHTFLCTIQHLKI